jgi:hypothetical protein
MSVPRTYRAGQSLEDYCRACKTDRMHTVMVADAHGQPIRVVCGYCGSEHNYRGGPRVDPVDERPATAPSQRPPAERRVSATAEPMPLVSERERSGPAMSATDARNHATETRTHGGEGSEDLEMLLRRIIREEAGLTPVAPAERWRGGTLVLRPGKPGLQEKTWPIETFFHKIVMVRNRLRTLEQQVNASELSDDAKVRVQGYITGCYGSLTSFNLLFADAADQFKGTDSD